MDTSESFKQLVFHAESPASEAFYNHKATDIFEGSSEKGFVEVHIRPLVQKAAGYSPGENLPVREIAPEPEPEPEPVARYSPSLPPYNEVRGLGLKRVYTSLVLEKCLEVSLNYSFLGSLHLKANP